MRLQQMIIGIMLLMSFGVSQAGEARHYLAIHSESYSDSDVTDSESYQYGYDFSNLLSVDISYANVGSTYTSVRPDSFTNVMLRLNRRYESITTYFTFGVSSIATTDLTADESKNYTALVYGVGIELYGNKSTAIVFSWTNTKRDESDYSIDFDTTRIGLIHHFDFAKSVNRY